MAEIGNWQRQNMKKGAAPSADPSAKLKGPHAGGHSKIAKPTHPCGGQVSMGHMGAAKPVQKFADGGMVTEEADKQAGLEASKGDTVGFFERLRMGNIDDPKSEAYDRFGAGMGRSIREARVEAENMAAEPPKKVELSDEDPAGPAVAEEKPRMTAADFQRTDKDTTPVPTPTRTAARRVVNAAPPKPVAAKPAKPASSDDDGPRGMSLSQRLGQRYAAVQRQLQNTSPSTGGYGALKQAAQDALKAYEDAAAAERSGRSVVFKR